MKIGVVVFPGSNCDHDAWYAVTHNLGHQAEFIWHDSQSWAMSTQSYCPEGSPTETTCDAARSPVFRP